MKELVLDVAIDMLNDILEADPKAISELFTHRVSCNNELADHRTVQVRDDNTVSALGVLNGLFGVDESGWGYIAAVCNEDGLIVKFARADLLRSNT